MKIRGERECRDCGTRWSYYETGEVTCPSCGSLRSRGVDERTEHTDAPVSLDLTAARNRVEEEGVVAAATAAAEECREYVRRKGFIRAGVLQPLSDTYLAAAELAHVGRGLDRRMRAPDDAEELYLVALLGGADRGERPDPGDVPDSMRAARGLAYAAAVDAYRDDLRTYLEDPDPLVRRVLERLSEHVRRIEALDGEVPAGESERLVHAAQDLYRAIEADDEGALATAESRLDDMA